MRTDRSTTTSKGLSFHSSVEGISLCVINCAGVATKWLFHQPLGVKPNAHNIERASKPGHLAKMAANASPCTKDQQQQQLKKLGIIIHYLVKFNHNWSLYTPRAPGQTASQSEPR